MARRYPLIGALSGTEAPAILVVIQVCYTEGYSRGTTLEALDNDAGVSVEMTAWYWWCHTRWISISCTCWCPLPKVVYMCCTTADSNCTWYDTGSLLSVTAPGLHWLLVTTITNHDFVTHCNLRKPSVSIMALLLTGLVLLTPFFPIQGVTSRMGTRAKGMSLEQQCRKLPSSEVYFGMTRGSFVIGFARTTNCTHPPSWLA